MTSVSALVVAKDAAATNPLIPEWGEVIIGTIAFAVLCAVLMRYAFPRAEELYEKRRDAIEGGIERAERLQAEARQTLEQNRAQLAEARAEASRIREEAHSDAAAIRREMEERVAQEREERLRSFEEQLAAQRAQAVAQLRREVGGVALELAQRIVGHELTRDERQRQLVDDFIAGLEAAPEEATGAVRAGS